MILVIGATSFIGIYTVNELLSQGEKVIVAGRNDNLKKYYNDKGVEFINFDLSDKNTFNNLPKENIETVILLAGLLPANAEADLETVDNAYDYLEINSLGTARLLEYCRENNIFRLISTTSYAEVSCAWEKGVPITEQQNREYVLEGDHAAYIISKNASSDLMYYYNNQHDMSNVVFRLPPVYGVGPHGTLRINGVEQKSGLQLFIEKSQNGDTIEIHGDGSLERDVVYVKDVAKALYLASKSKKAKGLYNITSGEALSLKKQVETIVDIFRIEKKSEIIFNKMIKNNTTSFLFSIEKAKNDFNYNPRYSEFRNMMCDYKSEIERGEYVKVFELCKRGECDV